MKIALVILQADPTHGGAERYTVDVATKLLARGHQVHLVSSRFADSIPASIQKPMRADGWSRKKRYARFVQSVSAHLENEGYDIVHAMLPIKRCDVYHPHAGMAANNLRKLSIHFNPRRKLMAAVERSMLFDGPMPFVLSLSELSKREILASYNIPDSRLLKLPNGVDNARFDPEQVAPANIPAVKGPFALFISQNFELKGLKQLIEATAKLRDAGLSLVVAGKDDPAKYQSLAKSLGATVHFLGPVADPRPLYKSARMFVLPTRHDQCSLVVLEALAMGTPVISTKFNGACDLMTDGVHGFVQTDPTDAAALAISMRKLLDDQVHAKMHQACLSLRATLSVEHHIDQLETIYAQVLAAGGKN